MQDNHDWVFQNSEILKYSFQQSVQNHWNKWGWKNTETCYDNEDATEQDGNDIINDKLIDDNNNNKGTENNEN